jgi:hypothetical protein
LRLGADALDEHTRSQRRRHFIRDPWKCNLTAELFESCRMKTFSGRKEKVQILDGLYYHIYAKKRLNKPLVDTVYKLIPNQMSQFHSVLPDMTKSENKYENEINFERPNVSVHLKDLNL